MRKNALIRWRVREWRIDMKFLKAAAIAALALLPLAQAAAPASAGVVVGVHVGPGHYCGWHHACWNYRWHGGYYNYYWHGRYYRNRWHCAHHWCYR
jgi:hypothetical protein